ncbi:acyl-CoA thioesterase [Candidatus Pacearchaeota archaeon]|nr:acyl-CoA thioesterase [Candidatus Pacearchaeota archaeon]
MITLTNKIIVPAIDIDSYDHVNFSNYLRYYQTGHQTLFRECLGLSYRTLEDTYKIRAVIRHAEINFIRELFAGDEITINTIVSRLGNSSMTKKQSIDRGETRMSEAEFVTVFTDLNKKPIRIPDWIRARINNFFKIE